jgi:hypothetical protein
MLDRTQDVTGTLARLISTEELTPNSRRFASVAKLGGRKAAPMKERKAAAGAILNRDG